MVTNKYLVDMGITRWRDAFALFLVLGSLLGIMIGLGIYVHRMPPPPEDASWPFCEAHGLMYREPACIWTARETDRLEAGEGSGVSR